jgi:hypothetical protein
MSEMRGTIEYFKMMSSNDIRLPYSIENIYNLSIARNVYSLWF